MVGTDAVPLAALDAGAEVTCGLSQSGSAYCTGDNGSGTVGVGYYGGVFTSLTPVVGGISFTEITSGGASVAHVCGLATSNDVYCWGSQSSGQLGNPDGVSRHTPTRVEN
jgi:alpha-tubulin suppressor-like RCC1 family protein